MKYTTNYQLKLPESDKEGVDDPFDVEDFNYNAEIVDNKLKENADALLSHKNETVTSGNNPHGINLLARNDGDILTGMYKVGETKYINVFSLSNISFSTIDTGLKIKTQIPYQNHARPTLILSGRLHSLHSPLLLMLSIWNRAASGFSNCGYSTINAIQPEIKVASENDLVVFHISGCQFQWGQINIDVIFHGSGLEFSNWSASAEAIDADAIDVYTLPLKS